MRPVPGFPRYFADREGNVYGPGRWKSTKLRPQRTRKGYLRYCCEREDGKRATLYGHRAVASAYGGLAPGDVVHHKNAIRNDNRLVNLEATSQRMNMRYKEDREWATANPFDAWMSGKGSLATV